MEKPVVRMVSGAAALGAVSTLVGLRIARSGGRAHGNGAAVQDAAAVEAEVRRANDRFYAGLNRMFTGDLAGIEEAWSHSRDVTLMNPFGGRQEGWRRVRAEFARTSKLTSGGEVYAEEMLVRTDGDLAYVVCRERGHNVGRDGARVPVDHRATSVFRREDGTWKMAHHHTDVASGLVDAFGRR